MVLFKLGRSPAGGLVQTGEEPSWWSCSNWGGAKPVVLFKLGRSLAGGLVQTGEEPSWWSCSNLYI